LIIEPNSFNTAIISLYFYSASHWKSLSLADALPVFRGLQFVFFIAHEPLAVY